MRVSIEQVAQRVEELVERAERGEDIFITRDGHDAAVLRPIAIVANEKLPVLSTEERRQALREILARTAAIPDPFPDVSAARSQDFLYDDDGLPG